MQELWSLPKCGFLITDWAEARQAEISAAEESKVEEKSKKRHTKVKEKTTSNEELQDNRLTIEKLADGLTKTFS